MTTGQLYGYQAAGGYRLQYSNVFNQVIETQKAAGVSLDRQIKEATKLDARLDEQSRAALDRFSRSMQEAGSGGDPSGNTRMGNNSLLVKIAIEMADLRATFSEQELASQEAYNDALERADNDYNTTNMERNVGQLIMDYGEPSEATSLAVYENNLDEMINDQDDAFLGHQGRGDYIDAYHWRAFREFVTDGYISKSKFTPAEKKKLEKYLESSFATKVYGGETSHISDANIDKADKEHAETYEDIKKLEPELPPEMEVLKTLYNSISGNQEVTGEATEESKMVLRAFRNEKFASFASDLQRGMSNEDLKNKYTGYDEHFDTLYRVQDAANKDLSIVPVQFAKLFSRGLIEREQANVVREKEISGLRQEKKEVAEQDLMALSAQRFLAQNPQPYSSLSEFDKVKRDYKRTTMGQNAFDLGLLQKSDPESWNDLSIDSQEMLAYQYATDDILGQWGSIEFDKIKAKGKVQKKALEVYTAATAQGNLSWADEKRLTAELFTDQKDIDEARAFIGALKIKAHTQTSPLAETDKVVDDMDVAEKTFRERIAARRDEKINPPIEVESYSGNQSGLPLEGSSLPENAGPTTSLVELQNWLAENGNPTISHMQQQHEDLVYDTGVVNETEDEASLNRGADNFEEGLNLFNALTTEQQRAFLDAEELLNADPLLDYLQPKVE
mgnify:CR=1 FL=1